MWKCNISAIEMVISSGGVGIAGPRDHGVILCLIQTLYAHCYARYIYIFNIFIIYLYLNNFSVEISYLNLDLIKLFEHITGCGFMLVVNVYATGNFVVRAIYTIYIYIYRV